MSSTAAMLGRPPKRVPMACRYCRKRKIKCEPQAFDARGSCKKCLEQKRMCEYVPVEADVEPTQFIPYMNPVSEASASHGADVLSQFGGHNHVDHKDVYAAMSVPQNYGTNPTSPYHAQGHTSESQSLYTGSVNYGMSVPSTGNDTQHWSPPHDSLRNPLPATGGYVSYGSIYPNPAMSMQQDSNSHYSTSAWSVANPASTQYTGMVSSPCACVKGYQCLCRPGHQCRCFPHSYQG